jgi:dihydrofolate reductase
MTQTMIISIIVAMDLDRAIGRENRLPWYLPKDMARFRRITMGHPVIMGRKTYESIGRPLPGRANIVITRQDDYCAEGCVVVRDLQTAFAACEGADEVFVLGGEAVFRDAMPLADRVYITVVHTRINGDAFFPELPQNMKLLSSESTEDVYPLEFQVYERKE